MARIGFIGLGNMGLPMAHNLVKAGHAVTGFDVSEYSTDRLAADGATAARTVAAACQDAEIMITMLPAGQQVREVYLGGDGVLAAVPPGSLLIDSSTIDVDTARAVAQAAAEQGLAMIDAPVSGGVSGAQAASLTFMVGGPDDAFARARPVLEQMGKTIVHAGGAGNGQHDPRRVDDRGVGSISPGGEARSRRAEAVRHFLEIVRPVLVDDELLPGAGTGADLARQP
jgi:3-hydroxyisobutyrate dehydrogenase